MNIVLQIAMTAFAASRHFNNPNFAGTKLPGTPEDFSAEAMLAIVGGQRLEEGYAPFCKHLFVENFTGCLSGVALITDKNKHLLQSEYTARREDELPVLSRFFSEQDIEVPVAPFLDIILYSAEQLKQEGEEIGGDWGIVSINSASQPAESPMPPITMMRNALGKDEGGSGVTLERKAYLESVEYWTSHATIKA